MALLAYSALDRLYVRCGPDQPWPVTMTTALDEVQRVQPVHVLLLDVVVPAEERQEVVMATATAGATAIDAYAADLETAPSRRGLKVGGALAVAAVGNLTEDAWDAIF